VKVPAITTLVFVVNQSRREAAFLAVLPERRPIAHSSSNHARKAFTTSQRHSQDAARRSLAAKPSEVLRRRFLAELAFYEADKPYLTADKCAARCQWLSQLLTAALCTADESDDTS